MQSSDGLRALIDAANIGIAQLDRDWRFRLVNDYSCSMLGYPSSFLLSHSLEELTFREDRDACLRFYKSLASGEASRDVRELRFSCGDGSVLWMRLGVSAVRDRSGHLECFVAVLSDISDYKRAEATLTQQARLLDIAHEAIIACDAAERITFWSSGAVRTFGWTAHEAVGRTCESLLKWSDANGEQQDRDAVHMRLERGETVSCTYTAERKDGVRISIAFNARAIFDSGALSGYVGVLRDVTKQLERDRANREREARLRALLESTPLGIAILDLERRPLFFNHMCEQLLGIPLDPEHTDLWNRALHPDDRAPALAAWQQATRERKPWSATFRVLHPDGNVRWLIARTAPAYVDGEPIGFAGTLEDITDFKLADAALQRLVDLERDARAQAEQATRLREELMAAVAHDLRDPLNTITTTAGMLRGVRELDPRAMRLLDILLRTSKRMDRLIRDLLDVSRIEAGSFAIEREPIDVAALCRETVELFEQAAREREVSLTYEVADALPVLIGDRDRLAQSLANVVGNALKFTPPRGFVRIRMLPEGRELHIFVQDDGSGIAAEDVPRLFDRFWRADPRSRTGAGLGLSITKAIVEAHGGRIWVESELGRGTIVHLGIPWSGPDPNAHAAAATPSSGATPRRS